MKKKILLNAFIVWVCLINLGSKTYGQQTIVGKYIDYQLNKLNYLDFHADSTFVFSFAVCAMRDIACGTYLANNDTVTLTYCSGVTDTLCNAEKIDIVQGKDGYLYFLGEEATGFRPTKLFLKNDRLYQFTDGKVVLCYKRFILHHKPPKYFRKYCRRKYLFLGPFTTKEASYMVKTN